MKRNFSFVFSGLFIVSIITALIGRAICIRDTKNYDELQPEFRGPDVIADVFCDEDEEMLYVCYNDASYVNVYNYSGEFLWAVSTPYLRNAYFELQDDKLIIYNSDTAYIYNSSDGSFIDHVSSDDMSLGYDSENEPADTVEEGEIYFKTYQVYHGQADGSLVTIVPRPWWYWCFHFGIDWMIGFSGGLGYGAVILFEKKKAHDLVRKKVVFSNPRTEFIFKYYRATAVAHLIFAALDVISGFFGGILVLGIFPVAIHFIISSVVLERMLDKLFLKSDEMKVFRYWKSAGMATFIIAFFSVIAAMIVASVS